MYQLHRLFSDVIVVNEEESGQTFVVNRRVLASRFIVSTDADATSTNLNLSPLFVSISGAAPCLVSYLSGLLSHCFY